jgi:hypothetical protein
MKAGFKKTIYVDYSGIGQIINFLEMKELAQYKATTR